MKKIVLSLVLFGSFYTSVNAQRLAKGIVFEDKNQNNKFDKSENVYRMYKFSNGKQVVSTNDKGEYQIEIDNETILFVIKPTNYKIPTNEFNQPQFYYINKPNGSQN